MQFSRNLINLYNQLSPKLPEILNSFLVSNPVFIVSTPRSGSTLLFEQLIRLDNIWSIGGESHVIFREFPHLRFENNKYDSACLSKHHADSQTSLLFKLATYSMLKNNRDQRLINMSTAHHKQGLFLEKTPRNALNIPFLIEAFPNAKFIYLYREPKQNVASIIEAWKMGEKTGQFITFPNLPGWDRTNWCFLLPRGWRKMNGKSLAEIAYFQWKESNRQIIKNLKQLPSNRWSALDYTDFIENPYSEISKLIKAFSIDTTINQSDYQQLALSKTTTSTPSDDKWRKHQEQMSTLIPDMREQYHAIKEFCEN